MSDSNQDTNALPFRVLGVDDEEGQRMSMKFALQSEGIEIELAGTGTEAMQKIDTKIYDLILLDLKLKDTVTGLDLLRQINEKKESEPGYKYTEVIIISAYVEKHPDGHINGHTNGQSNNHFKRNYDTNGSEGSEEAIETELGLLMKKVNRVIEKPYNVMDLNASVAVLRNIAMDKRRKPSFLEKTLDAATDAGSADAKNYFYVEDLFGRRLVEGELKGTAKSLAKNTKNTRLPVPPDKFIYSGNKLSRDHTLALINLFGSSFAVDCPIPSKNPAVYTDDSSGNLIHVKFVEDYAKAKREQKAMHLLSQDPFYKHMFVTTTFEEPLSHEKLPGAHLVVQQDVLETASFISSDYWTYVYTVLTTKTKKTLLENMTLLKMTLRPFEEILQDIEKTSSEQRLGFEFDSASLKKHETAYNESKKRHSSGEYVVITDPKTDNLVNNFQVDLGELCLGDPSFMIAGLFNKKLFDDSNEFAPSQQEKFRIVKLHFEYRKRLEDKIYYFKDEKEMLEFANQDSKVYAIKELAGLCQRFSDLLSAPVAEQNNVDGFNDSRISSLRELMPDYRKMMTDLKRQIIKHYEFLIANQTI